MGKIELYGTRMASPLGPLSIWGSSHAVESICWNSDQASAAQAATQSCPVIDECAKQLRAYFDGRLTTFDIPTAPAGTAFQRSVWQLLMDIPFGQTLSYGQLAQTLQPPSGPRAIGSAVGRNPILLVLPCHRIIGSRGDLTGFAGGLERKEWLLTHEGSILC